MKHLKTYDNYLLENFNYDLLLESSDMSTYRKIQDKTMKSLSLNFYFANNFGWGVPMLCPIVEALIKNSGIVVTQQQVFFLTMFAITQIVHLANNDVKKIREELEKDNLLELSKKVTKSLLSIQKIFTFVAKGFGKVVDSFIDILAYVSIGTPFTMAVVEYFSQEGLNLDTLPQKVAVFAGGTALMYLKNLAETLIEMMKNKMNFKKQI